MGSPRPTPSPPKDRRSMADSPWFWVCIFAGAALVGLLVIAPKYAHRSQRLWQRYQGYQEMHARQLTGSAKSPDMPTSPDEAPTATPRTGRSADSAPPSVWPVAGLLAAVLVFASLGIWWAQSRRRTAEHCSDTRTQQEHDAAWSG